MRKLRDTLLTTDIPKRQKATQCIEAIFEVQTDDPFPGLGPGGESGVLSGNESNYHQVQPDFYFVPPLWITKINKAQ